MVDVVLFDDGEKYNEQNALSFNAKFFANDRR